MPPQPELEECEQLIRERIWLPQGLAEPDKTCVRLGSDELIILPLSHNALGR